MKKTCVLKFRNLADLALFLKTIQPKGYTINTVHFTLTAPLTLFERSMAIENYQAEEIKKATAPSNLTPFAQR